MDKDTIQQLFSSVNSRKKPLVEQTEYLVDGYFKQWNGDFKEVYSAVKSIDEAGNLTDVYLGKIQKQHLWVAISYSR